jgi:hypothetical protein
MRGSQDVLLVRPTILPCDFFPLHFFVVPGARPSKRKIGDISDIKDSRRRKRGKAKATVPPSGCQVIDLENDTPAASTASLGATSLVGSSVTHAADPPSTTSTALPTLCPTQQEPPTPIINSVPTAHVSPSSTLPFAPATLIQAPVHTHVIPSDPSEPSVAAASSPSLLSFPPAPTDDTTPSQTATSKDTTTTSSVSLTALPALTHPVLDSDAAVPSEQGKQVQVRPRRRVSYLSQTTRHLPLTMMFLSYVDKPIVRATHFDHIGN